MRNRYRTAADRNTGWPGLPDSLTDARDHPTWPLWWRRPPSDL